MSPEATTRVTVERLQDADELEYEQFVRQSTRTLLYHGAKYRRFLRALLGAEDWYLVARDGDGAIAGALPAFLRRDEGHGAVLNSLPYYGSNGGILEFNGDRAVRRQLISAFDQLAADARCLTSTIITSPFEQDPEFYEQLTFDASDDRLGQITPLPQSSQDDELMASFHRKARNAVRKSQQMPLTITGGADPAVMRFLVETHQENMAAVGGPAKTDRSFALIAEIFECGRDYDVWVARHEGAPVAAMLIFYYNQTAEYYTPVVLPQYRSWQPLSRLVLEAMRLAVDRGFHFWNWGGTQRSQESLIRFKSRLGASERVYRYYTRILDRGVLNRSASELLSSFPHFYVVPFRALTHVVQQG